MHYRTGAMALHGLNQFKTIAYNYDLISGKVNKVYYQPGMNDAMTHRYEYDAENRLTNVYTTDLSGIEEQEARYYYYKHGPLAKVIIGQQQVQGLNYVYTLQGWLKAVNPDSTIEDAMVARSSYNYSLHYYEGDYAPIGTGTLPIINISSSNTGFKSLYNGNIGAMAVNIKQFSQPLVYMYGYDQLNRLMNATTYNGWNGVSTFSPSSINDYKEQLTYDPNGNILTDVRNGTTSGGNQLTMDNLTYQYPKDANGNLINNRLRYVYDGVSSSNYTTDIDNQTSLTLAQVQAEKSTEVSTDNYRYDAIGNLVKDAQGGISSITWTVYGKIKTIVKSDGTLINYTYDAAGNRIGKGVTKSGITTTTWYVRDANGSVMAVYTENTGVLKLMEQHLYGSARLGILNKSQDMDASVSAFNATFTRGMKSYELTNHLGNVLVTISDKKLPAVVTGGVVTAYSPVVVSANDNYSFGMGMPQRTFSTSSYRYGFNGKELDKDINSTGADYDYGERIYDPRLGRWLSMDKQFKNSPELTPYRISFNNPLRWIDNAGNFETDGHYWTVYMVGLMIGLDNTKAEHLAHLAERPDNNVHNDYRATEQNYTYLNGNRQKQTHSLLGSNTSVGGNILFAIDQLFKAKNDDQTSNALHYFGDAFAHQRMDGKGGYYGDRGGNISWGGKAFEFFFQNASAEHAKALGQDGEEIGNAPDLIYNRPDLYKQYVTLLAQAMRIKYSQSKELDMNVIDKMVNYATKNKVSLIGIINYEVSKLKHESSFFLAKNPGMAPDGYDSYINNTKNYLNAQGVLYSTEKVYTSREVSVGDGQTVTEKVEQGTKFTIQKK